MVFFFYTACKKQNKTVRLHITVLRTFTSNFFVLIMLSMCYILNVCVMYFTIMAFFNFGLWFTLLHPVSIMLFSCSVSHFGRPCFFLKLSLIETN